MGPQIIQMCLDKPQSFVHNCFMLENDILYKLDRSGNYLLVIANALIVKILNLYHDSHILVHLTQKQLFDVIRTRFYWNEMHRDCCDWVAVCTKKQPTSFKWSSETDRVNLAILNLNY